MVEQKPPKQPEGPTGIATPPGQQVILSSQLLQGAKAVLIEHNGERYQLRATSRGKLILTK